MPGAHTIQATSSPRAFSENHQPLPTSNAITADAPTKMWASVARSIKRPNEAMKNQSVE